MMNHKDTHDIVGGLILTALGAFAAYYAQQYGFGELTRMGPGYFPVALGIIVAVLGLIIVIPAFMRRGEPIHVEWKTAGLVIASIVSFALTLKFIGLVPATMLSVLISSLADRETRWKGRLIIAVGVAAVTYLVFSVGLSMTLPIWPWGN